MSKIHPTAVIEEGAVLGANVEIGPYSIVSCNVVLEDDVVVKAHVFLCMLAYYVEWHLRRDLAPLLFGEGDSRLAEAQRKSPVEPARPSAPTKAKRGRKRTEDGFMVHNTGGGFGGGYHSGGASGGGDNAVWLIMAVIFILISIFKGDEDGDGELDVIIPRSRI